MTRLFTPNAGRELIPMSPSKIITVLSCPLKGQRRYIQRLSEAPGLAAHRGSMLHAALEASRGTSRDVEQHLRAAWLDPSKAPWDPADRNKPRWREWRDLFAGWLELRDEMAPAIAELDAYAEQIKADALAGLRKGGAQAPRMTKDFKRREDELLAPWGDTLESLRSEERALLDDPQRSPWAPTYQSAFDQYVSSVEAARVYARWWDSLTDDQRPEVVHTERKFQLPYEEFNLNGIIDRIDLNPVTGDVEVVDYKSGKHEGKTERFVQAGIYALGAERVIGARPTRVKFINLDEDPAGPDWTHTYPVQTGWDFEVLRLCRWAHAALNGAPIPSFNGCSYCSYFDQCFGPDSGVMQFAALEHATAEEAATA